MTVRKMNGNNMDSRSITVIVLTIAVILALGFLAYSFLNMPDNRTVGEKIDDSVNALKHDSPKQAVRELQNRTPGQKIGEAVEDAGEKIQDETKR